MARGRGKPAGLGEDFAVAFERRGVLLRIGARGLEGSPCRGDSATKLLFDRSMPKLDLKILRDRFDGGNSLMGPSQSLGVSCRAEPT
jgi:hypothetical protein